MSAISLTIDGSVIEVAPGTTILEAARQLGIDIPTFCHDPELSPNGACRICVVEVENARALVASCVAPVGPNMVVHTESERVVNARKAVLNLMLANHPLDCITCEKTGECKLQDYCYRYNVAASDLIGEVKDLAFDDTNEFFIRDMNKCILCGICVGKCQEVVGAGAIDFTKRGFVTNVGPAFEDTIEESTCVFCGMCIDNCPVGALIPKYMVGQGRPWQVEKVRAICPYCSLGCNLDLHVREGKVIGVTPVKETPVNRGHLCARGKFGWDHINSTDRITAPLVRSNGVFVEVSWEEALDFIVDNIREIQDRHGSGALMGLGSPKAGNEDNYLFQKLIRSLGSNNVDSYTRHCHAPAVDATMEAFGVAGTTNSIEEIASTGAVLVIGANPAQSHPIIEYRIREAVQRGAALIVAEPEPIELVNAARQYLAIKPGSEVALANAMANVIIEEDLYDKEFVKKRTAGFDQLKAALSGYDPAACAAMTGIGEDEIRTAARLYASADQAIIVSASGTNGRARGADLVSALANLALLTGNLGRASAGLYLPYGENNLQGSADMGILPDMLTGYQPLADQAVRDKFSAAWGVELSDTPGLSAEEVFGAGGKGTVKAMFVMGENPAACGGDRHKTAAFLSGLDFLVVQDIFMTETAALADVVLPAAAFSEKMATYTNTERRVQLSSPAVEPPGEVYPDWAILAELADWFGLDWDYDSPEMIFNEIVSLTPDYAGMSYERLAASGLQWPCPQADHPGTAFLFADQFGRASGQFKAVEYSEPAVPEKGHGHGYAAECCDGDHRHDCHCLSESMSRHSLIKALKNSCCQ